MMEEIKYSAWQNRIKIESVDCSQDAFIPVLFCPSFKASHNSLEEGWTGSLGTVESPFCAYLLQHCISVKW